MKGRPSPERTPIIDGKPLPVALNEEVIHDVVHGFYDKIRKDDLLGPIFTQRIAPDAWPHHLATMCDFWSSTLLRTGRYHGRPLPPHLRIPQLSEQHFHRWLQLFRSTVRKHCTPDVAALFLDRALRIAHSFRLAIAFNRQEDTTLIRPIDEESL